jgi:glyoxylase-like metal-dependent hydrolase (beta-lactamase superfamily II)/rhodanese-related sulfurtransferase
LKHFFIKKIAHSSYLLAGKKEAAVIDPQRDIDHYLAEAENWGVKIRYIFETHLHADFVSGHLDLAKATGAKICAAKSAHCLFDHLPLIDNECVLFEDIVIKVLETPGHTPEHLSLVVIDTSRSEKPVGVFTGDTLLVGDVGRPDLFPGIAENLAGQLFDSLHHKLLCLPDYCEVYPAHGAGSLCGRTIGGKWLTTIGYERRFNNSLQIKDKGMFIQSLTENMPPAPDHFSRCSDINRQGPQRLTELPDLEAISASEFSQKIKSSQTQVIDVRPLAAYCRQHIPKCWHIDLSGNFPTYAGWLLPADTDFLLLAEDDKQAFEANLWARRVGIDRIKGYLQGGLDTWIAAGFSVCQTKQVPASALFNQGNWLEKGTLIDVRDPLEYSFGHISGAVNIPLADLRVRYQELNPKDDICLVCSSGFRSCIAGSILEQHGFNKISNLRGGMDAYQAESQ